MNSLSEKDWMALLLLNRLGVEDRRRARNLFAEGHRPERVVELLDPRSVAAHITFDPQKELSLCWQKGVSLCSILEDSYPVSLREIADPPLVLYMKGRFELNDENALAVVGTRHPSFYGRTQAKRFAGELASKGVTIVSGLARGIDQAAHEAALDVPYGRTIAVLGCGIDIVYPKEHVKLFERISQKGVLISEYAIGTPPLAENFPRRNRIISGLGHGVLVVEAHSRSGSLITAHEALDQGREVFSIPGPVDQLTSRGTHQLIKEGAVLAESPEEVFEALSGKWKVFSTEMSAPVSNASAVCPFKEVVDEKKLPPKTQNPEGETPLLTAGENLNCVVEALNEEGSLMTDEILDITGLDPGELPGILLKLELDGKIRRRRDGKYETGSS
ncbi:MAG TPA: DNA-processing protein DprA [Candidatus Omnitrophota bacterium]|nr:DNA-processing protein DprA [Candidatus Omnitrophota bacterium]